MSENLLQKLGGGFTRWASVGLIAGTLLFPFYGCKNLTNSKEDEKSEYERYAPTIERRFSSPNHYIISESSDEKFGATSFGFPDNVAYNVRFYYNPISDSIRERQLSGIEGTFYREANGDSSFLFVRDPKGVFLPEIIDASRLTRWTIVSDSASSSDIIHSRGWDIINLISKYEFGVSIPSRQSFSVRQIESSIPFRNPQTAAAFSEVPGMVYRGSWSFNRLKNLNTTLKNASAIMVFVPEPTTTAVGTKIYSITSAIGRVADGLEHIVDYIDERIPQDLQKYKDYEIPMFSLGFRESPLWYFQTFPIQRSESEDIEFLLPLVRENRWTYQWMGREFDVEVDRIGENVNGTWLTKLNNESGAEEYLGFRGNSLHYYGFEEPSLGKIFFEPAIEMGDNNLKVGRSFETNSKIVLEDYPHLVGNVREVISYVGREEIVLSNGIPFGDAFRMQEDFDLTLRNINTGEEFHVDSFATSWLVKNVGKVKMTLGDMTMELADTDLNNDDHLWANSLDYSALSNVNSLLVNPEIISSIKEIVSSREE